jgi:signal peptidase I
MTRRTATRIVALALIIVASVAAWAVLAPPELGGSTRYVVTQGSSMEPLLHAGDLGLVRASGRVEKGDVVLYEHPRLGTRVLHRVIRVHDGRYVVKGDNNDFVDDVRPTDGEIDGKLWIALPRVGSALMWAREPLHTALLIFVLTFFALGGGAAIATLGTRRHREPVRPAADPTRSSSAANGTARVLLAGGLAGLAVFGLLAAASRSTSATRNQPVADAYAQVGSFSYSAQVEPSEVYPEGLLGTGDSVFLSIVPKLDLAFDYRLDAKDASRIRGTVDVDAVLSDGAGWQRQFPLVEQASFVGRTAHSDANLDLESLAATVDEMKAVTGSGTTTFSVRLTANVLVRGEVDGAPITKRFSPELPLLLDTVSLRPDSSEAFRSVVRKSEAGTVSVPATLAVGGLRLEVKRARTIALAGLVLAFLAGVIGAAAFWRTREPGEPSQIASLFGDRLITISRPPSLEPARITELRDVVSLYRLAEHHNRVVLHWREGREHVYEVDDRGSVYRYRLSLGVEPSPHHGRDEEDTAILPATKLPARSATG